MPAVFLPPGIYPTIKEHGKVAQETSESKNEVGAEGPLPTLRPRPPPRSFSPQSLPLPVSRALLSAEVGPGRTRHRGDMPGGPLWTGSGWIGRRVAAPQPARDYLPSTRRLPLSLACEAPASCVFRLLGNGGGVRRLPRFLPAYTPPTAGVVNPDISRPVSQAPPPSGQGFR